MIRWPGAAPFLLGAAASVVVEAGLGLLLYISPGLLPALTVLLAVSLGSLAAGVASRPGAGSSRWRWFLAAGALAVAAAVSLGWSFGTSHDAGPWVRGLNLAGLLALPLYGIGLCAALTLEGEDGRSALVAALLGGVAGVVALGALLVPRAEPASVYLFCLLCVSAAALLHRER